MRAALLLLLSSCGWGAEVLGPHAAEVHEGLRASADRWPETVETIDRLDVLVVPRADVDVECGYPEGTNAESCVDAGGTWRRARMVVSQDNPPEIPLLVLHEMQHVHLVVTTLSYCYTHASSCGWRPL
jgi:hypothetical protein